jgi:hypothetical protein
MSGRWTGSHLLPVLYVVWPMRSSFSALPESRPNYGFIPLELESAGDWPPPRFRRPRPRP